MHYCTSACSTKASPASTRATWAAAVFMSTACLAAARASALVRGWRGTAGTALLAAALAEALAWALVTVAAWAASAPAPPRPRVPGAVVAGVGAEAGRALV